LSSRETDDQMYRVYQACDSAAKQNASRTAQACVRNAFAQRAMKPSFKSTARINKDAMMKGKRVVKEVSQRARACACPLLRHRQRERYK